MQHQAAGRPICGIVVGRRWQIVSEIGPAALHFSRVAFRTVAGTYKEGWRISEYQTETPTYPPRTHHGWPAALTRAAQRRGKQLCESLRHFTALRRTLFLPTYAKWDLSVAMVDHVCNIRSEYCAEA